MNTQEYNVLESTLPNTTTNWKAINWLKIEKYVVKLQNRIYRAENEGDVRKVKSLQRLLVKSNAVLLLAIRRVTQLNKGRRTPSIDGFRALSNKKRGELFDKMKNMNIRLHNPKPAYRTYIQKKNGKTRPLGIPAIIDRIYQEIVRLALEPQAEVNFEPISYGFRPKRGCHDAVQRIFYNIRGGKWEWVFEGDFKSCFDTLDHDFILKQIKDFPFCHLVEKFLKAGYVDKDVFYNTENGTPQGGLLSPLLANIALDGLEKLLNIEYIEKQGKNCNIVYITKGDYRVVRYADDFLIFAKSKEEVIKLYEILEPYLKDRGLTLAEDKTHITHISRGFDFLGFNFRQYKTKDGLKCFIKPSKDSIKNFKLKVSEIFRKSRGHNVDELIKSLNPLIRGTANYWRPTVAKKIFSLMDHYIFDKMYKFLRRLHPKKGWNWIKNKYFPFYFDGKHYGNWVLTGPNENNHLINMAWTPIKRHVMIQYDFSPYDESKSDYFKNRALNC
jgi:RNA-directed DNA polymerase